MAANQIHRNTMKEKEIIEEDKEKIMKHLSFPLSTTPIQGRDRAIIFENMTTNARSNLIPRVIVTNIMVYYNPESAFTADMLMAGRAERGRINAVNAGSAQRNGNNALAGVRTAIDDQNKEMLKSILKAKNDLINSFDDDGLTPLSYAASKGLVEIVSCFLKHFPKSIYVRNKDKSFPIHKACLGGHVEILKRFHSKFPKSLSYGDQHEQTVLHLAAKQRGNKLMDVVSYLLTLQEGRVLLEKNDENGRKPLELAKLSSNDEVEKLIRSIR